MKLLPQNPAARKAVEQLDHAAVRLSLAADATVGSKKYDDERRQILNLKDQLNRIALKLETKP